MIRTFLEIATITIVASFLIAAVTASTVIDTFTPHPQYHLNSVVTNIPDREWFDAMREARPLIINLVDDGKMVTIIAKLPHEWNDFTVVEYPQSFGPSRYEFMPDDMAKRLGFLHHPKTRQVW